MTPAHDARQHAEHVPASGSVRFVIGIDPGTRCGWAVLTPGGTRIASGAWDLGARRHEGGGMKFVRLRSYLLALLDAHTDAVLGYEEVRRHLGTDAAHVYGGIVATVAAVCEERGVPYRGQPVATVKRAATGKGTAKKDAMVEAAVAAWGGSPSEDEADALWVAETLRREVA